MAACREHPPHTDPYGSVQHCHTGSPQPSLPDHMAGHRHNLAQQAIVLTTCWLRSCQPSIRDRCESSGSAEAGVSLSLILFVFDFGPPPRFTALCACLVALGARAQA